MEMKYFKPRSVTWWFGGVIPIVAGLIMATEPITGLTAVVASIASATGGMSPAVLINMGIAGIGLRGAMK